ncbi:MAG: hypothetical protein AMJ69_06745 [Gammaproteobacteria bacterium SG8_47]|nr:MAG: hypothetical protein AMJ69_06745 [Gammaproteobacteria bacterium SG8_47]
MTRLPHPRQGRRPPRLGGNRCARAPVVRGAWCCGCPRDLAAALRPAPHPRAARSADAGLAPTDRCPSSRAPRHAAPRRAWPPGTCRYRRAHDAIPASA